MNLTHKQSAARLFAQTWKGRGYEKGEAQSFWYQLLHDVYGVDIPANFIKFEYPVHIKNSVKYIDAYIPSTKVLIENKDKKRDLEAANKQSDGRTLTPIEQAMRYIGGLQYSLYPRWIVTCNFKSFKIYDMEQPQAEPIEVLLENLEREYYLLNFLVDDTTEKLQREKQLSIDAGCLIGRLYEELHHQYLNPQLPSTQHSLNVLCVRLVFCLFAEKSNLFGDDRNAFQAYLNHYKPSQMRRALMELFEVLDTEEGQRDPYLEDILAKFPYVNGGLFSKKENIEIPNFTNSIASLLINECSTFDWSGISPTIFGALFEDTLNPDTREIGSMHYTSVENIHRVIDPLFLNDLKREFKEIFQIKTETKRKQLLLALQTKIARLKIFDPACGSGNFLTETYISLRKLENEIIKILYEETKDIHPIQVKTEQFYGVEVNDFAVTVAKAALWIAEAQMMKETESIVHKELEFLPLKSHSNIRQANALVVDWGEIICPSSLSYIIGNPPFKGKKNRKKEQKSELENLISADSPQPGNLDYVSGWFFKAARFIQNTHIKVSFVSTINITRGEQVSLLWKPLIEKYHITINYAYLPFEWYSKVKKTAQVHCTIIGFGCDKSNDTKILYSGDTDEIPQVANNISPYLRDEETIIVSSRPSGPLSDVPATKIGNKPIDGGYLLFNREEKEKFIESEPKASKYFYEWYGAEELIKGKCRYFLWLDNCSPAELRKMPFCKERLEKVKEVRRKSTDKGTRKLADYPTKFHVPNIPDKDFIVIPEVTSENREYIPMEYVYLKNTTKKLFSNLVKLMSGASLYHFGILQSKVHMIWTKAICGYKDFRPRYSTNVVFNNFPWPNIPDKEQAKIAKSAKRILDARNNHPECSLADLYDTTSMPDDLRKAHQDNDKIVMAVYGFTNKSEADIIKALLQLYREMTNKA